MIGSKARLMNALSFSGLAIAEPKVLGLGICGFLVQLVCLPYRGAPAQNVSRPFGNRRRRSKAIFVADAHRGNGNRFVVRADEKLTAIAELESQCSQGNRQRRPSPRSKER